MGGISDAVFPLVGVVIGGGITSGFEVWKRKQDRRDRNLDQLTQVVLDVQSSGSEALLRADLLVLDLVRLKSYLAVMETPAFGAHNSAAARYLGAIAAARVLTIGQLHDHLVNAQEAFNEALVDAKDAAAAIGQTDHDTKLMTYSEHLTAAREAHNTFMLAAVAHLQAQRAD